MPTNASLLARRQNAVPRGVATAYPIFAARADNAELWDVEGRRYIDFAGGIAVLNTGHRHPKVVAAIEAQLARLTHSAFQVVAYEVYVELAERLNALAPFKEAAKTILFTTGAEAAENAVKIARAATGRSGIIAFAGGFHGRTMLAMALTGKVNPYKAQFGSLPGQVYHVPFPSPETGVTVAETFAAIDFIFRADIAPSHVAAIIFEPVQGEGGFHEASQELFEGLRRICDKHGIMLIADEVQTGFARTGSMFAVERSGVEPDLVAVAKALGGGLPISGVVGRAKIMDAVDPGGLGGTFAGNPLACAAALAVLDVIKAENLLTRAEETGRRMKDRLLRASTRNDIVPIAAVRGPGAMVAFDVVRDRSGAEPDADAAKRVTARALDSGLILLTCGTYGNTIRLLAPLTASDAIIDEGLDRLESALAEPR